MQIINDYYMMTVTQRYESSKTASGIITLNTAWVQDEVGERHAYKRIYGRIEMPPLQFTEQVIEVKDPGYPSPRVHVRGEDIAKKYNEGYKKKAQKRFYNCAGLDSFDLLTIAEVAKKCDIRKFDKIYFNPNVTEPENHIGQYQGREMYKIAPQDIFCVVREGKILTQGLWTLLEPDMETWEEITTKSGIIKKPQLGVRYLRGIVRHFHGRDDIKEGDTIVHEKGADWLLKIEGKEYYAIEHDDILCKIEL